MKFVDLRRGWSFDFLERRIDEIFVNLRRGRSFDFSAAHPINNMEIPGRVGWELSVV